MPAVLAPDPKHIVALATVETAVSEAMSTVVQATSNSLTDASDRASKRRRLCISLIERDDASFRLTFGCHRQSFAFICSLVELHWPETNRLIGNSRFSLQDRVAVTIYYLTHCGSLEDAASAHGMTATAASRYVWQVVDVLLLDSVKAKYFQLPTTNEEWSQLSDEFEKICGYPNCCLAIGGMLVEIQQPRQWEGWYCSKNYPAENVQLVVDSKFQVRSMDVRPGGITDKETLRYSRFGRNLAEILPEGKHIIGHGEYNLSNQVVVPYPVTSTMSMAEKMFNSLQSTTQRVVKQASEMIKKRFRILQMPLTQRTEDGDAATTRMAQVISSAIVLHNVLIDLNDLVEIDSSLGDDTDEEDMDNDSDAENSDVDETMDGDATIQLVTEWLL
ncbi:hypothetical protein BBJ29_003745 [Phytophthora kernoviae]|uniref:DDE Tnp4 domain-containing protein n=1 Tax=Phytophthora kernoviae TaxID=325452 RepID=A0A3R7JU12_9STRA|nr:hypothetical protein BBJ29_003745 [Phytophthora kernoviae]